MSRAPEPAILLAGVPRSGSSWVGKVLSRAPGLHYCREPDNEKTWRLARVLKAGLHRFPYLEPGQRHSGYERLWRLALGGRAERAEALLARLRPELTRDPLRLEREVGEKCGLVHLSWFRHTGGDPDPAAGPPPGEPPLGDPAALLQALEDELARADPAAGGSGRVLCKSVHCLPSLPWLDARFSPRVVVLLRDPLNVIASTLTLCMGDAVRNVWEPRRALGGSGPRAACRGTGDREVLVHLMGEQLAVLYAGLHRQLRLHPHWILLEHEALCEDPEAQVRSLLARLGLEWSAGVERELRESEGPGEGFRTKRVARTLPGRWREILREEEVEEVERVFGRWGLCRRGRRLTSRSPSAGWRGQGPAAPGPAEPHVRPNAEG